MRKNNKYLNCHTVEKRSFDVSISAIFFILLFPFSSHATCTPTPDCASIGYTETSCEGDSLKCPFDISKLYCVSCDSSFKYECVGDNIVIAVGEACGNKYVTCECVAGATFINGSCICDTSCTVGNIYYSDKTCSSCLDKAKTPIGIVVKDNELVMSRNRNTSMYWGTYGTDVDTLTNYSSSADAKTDFNGKGNTTLLVEFQTTEGLTSSNSPAIYCNEYSTDGTSAGDWYLPAVGELYSYVYGNYSAINTAMTTLSWAFGNYYFWSSSEYSSNLAWNVSSNDGDMYAPRKNLTRFVTCFLAIN